MPSTQSTHPLTLCPLHARTHVCTHGYRAWRRSCAQNISVPLSYDKDGSGAAALKRYAAQLRDVARQAGFGEPAVELQAKLQEAAAGVCLGVAYARGSEQGGSVGGTRSVYVDGECVCV